MVNVLLSADPPGSLVTLLPDVLPDDVAGALALAQVLGRARAESLRDTWEVLATLAAHDLGVARAVEPHLDAAAILTQAGLPVPDGSWGVFAAEGGDDPLVATEGVGASGVWTLSGTKPWCSLADRLDGALVTATTGSARRLFAVDLRQPGVVPATGSWVARGLTEIPSGPVHFDAVPATPVGEAGWYLERPGFAWGGIGVAACWYGGAVGIARTVHAAARRAPNPFLLEHLGAIDELLGSARRALAEAADLVDAGGLSRPPAAVSKPDPDPRLLAKRVRATVARACEETLLRAGHALGPAPLALDAAHAKRVADLQLYVRQHHAERDLASLGEALAGADAPW